MGDSAVDRTRGATRGRRNRATLTTAGIGVVLVAGVLGTWLLSTPPLAPSDPGSETSVDSGRVSGADPDAAAVDGSEVLPPAESVVTTEHLPPVEPTAPRVTVPLPASGTQEGGLVTGFPADLAGPADGSEVLDTMVTSEGGVMQFTLRAHTTGSADELLAHYREQWIHLGLAPAATEASALSYRDAYSSVTVTAEAGGTGVVYSVHGVLRAG